MSESRALTSRPRQGKLAPPYKRLIVCCDGTWLNSDNGLLNGELEIPSNVTRLSRAIKPVSGSGIPQVVYYHFGVGGSGSIYDKIVGGATGEGLDDNVRAGYSFVSTNYSPGDEIFLIGFSRGAFTARSIAGLISVVGVLTKDGMPGLVEIFEDVKNRRDPDYRPKNPNVPYPRKPSASDPRYAEELERLGMTHLDVGIKAIGVWDTVGSLGVPRLRLLTKVGLQSTQSKETTLYDTKLNDNIENAFQALALDEKRAAFQPALWEKPRGNQTKLRQVWFPGVHSNVGGGYDDQQLANITLAWMMAQLDPFLDLDMDYILEQDDENEDYYRSKRQRDRPWSFGKIINSLTGIYALGGGTPRDPGHYHALDPYSGRVTSRPLRDTHEYIHASVRTRFRLGGPGVDDRGAYDPDALLDDWRLVIEHDADGDAGGPDGPAQGGAEIYWKRRTRPDRGFPDALPEAPLYGIEKRLLARTDKRTWRYVTDAPATGAGGGGGGGEHRRRRRKSTSVHPGHMSASALEFNGGGGGGGGGGSVSGSRRSRRRASYGDDGESVVAARSAYGGERASAYGGNDRASAYGGGAERAPSRAASVYGGGERASVYAGTERAVSPARSVARSTGTARRAAGPAQESRLSVVSSASRPNVVARGDGWVLEERTVGGDGPTVLEADAGGRWQVVSGGGPRTSQIVIDERGVERDHGRDYDRDHGRDYDRDHGRDYDRDHGRDHGRDYGRDRGRDYEVDRGRDRGRNYEVDYERDHVYERDRERDYGRR